MPSSLSGQLRSSGQLSVHPGLSSPLLCSLPTLLPHNPVPLLSPRNLPTPAGGSEAHATFFQRQRGDWEAATQSRDLLTSVRRFYSGMITDAEKQVGQGWVG